LLGFAAGIPPLATLVCHAASLIGLVALCFCRAFQVVEEVQKVSGCKALTGAPVENDGNLPFRWSIGDNFSLSSRVNYHLHVS
jgi:hypothetical protein